MYLEPPAGRRQRLHQNTGNGRRCPDREQPSVERTRALWVGQGVHEDVNEALVPNDILIYRNYMVSQLAARTSGLVLTTVKDVRVYHNIISHYDSGLTIHGYEFENRDIQIRNNLFHEQEFELRSHGVG